MIMYVVFIPDTIQTSDPTCDRGALLQVLSHVHVEDLWHVSQNNVFIA